MHEKNGKVISVFSNKGGVGKSTIAINMAVYLATKDNAKVAIFDLDLMSGDIAIMLDLAPKSTIVDVSRDLAGVYADDLSDYMIKHSSGIMVLPAPMSPEQAEFISVSCVDKVLGLLMEKYDYIVVDTGVNFSDINLTVLDHSTKIFYISAMDIPTIKNTRVGLDIIKRLNYDEKKLDLIMNRFSNRYGVNIKDVEDMLNKKITKVLPIDESTVVLSANRGEPFILKMNTKPVSKGLVEIAESIKGGVSK
jgi:pilus assembly protein CpaE